MLSSTESHMWLRYLAVERMRHYHNQLRYKPDRTFFHLELHGSVLDNVQELKDALVQCSCLESIVLDHFQCDMATWNTLQECIQILAMKKNSTSPPGQQRRGFKVQLRRIHILMENTTTPDQTLLAGDNDAPIVNTSGVYLAKCLSQLSHYLSELHVIDCDIPSYGAQVLFTTCSNNNHHNHNHHNNTSLADHLNIQSSLRLLSLEGNTGIGNIGLTFLARALTATDCLANLQTLSVERVGASQDGLCTLLDALRHHPHLTCLNIMGNVMTLPTWQYLLDVLIHDNTILQQVQWDRSITNASTTSPTSPAAFPSSMVDPSSSSSAAAASLSSLSLCIDFWLRANRAGRRWIVRDSKSWSIPMALWPRILQRFNNNHDTEVLYYVLRSRPEFCSSYHHQFRS